jgi:hypothetical protein
MVSSVSAGSLNSLKVLPEVGGIWPGDGGNGSATSTRLAKRLYLTVCFSGPFSI